MLLTSTSHFLVSTLVFVGLVFGDARQIQAQPNRETSEATEVARYNKLDRFARELPELQATTMSQLPRSLAVAAHSDDDKAQLIFAWLAYHVAYDTDYLQGNRSRGCSPTEVLRNRRAICQGYADLFTTLARLMQVPAHTVTGYARTSARDAKPQEPNHAWNVYLANGTWHLADATWAAGSVSSAYRFAPKYDPLWFDTLRYRLLRYHVDPVVPLRELRHRSPDPDNVAYTIRQRAQWPGAAVAQSNYSRV